MIENEETTMVATAEAPVKKGGYKSKTLPVRISKRGLFLAAYDLQKSREVSFGEALKSIYALNNVNKFKEALRDGVVVFKFIKRDGSIRTAVGTLNSKHVPEGSVKGTERETTREKIEQKVIRYWDLSVNGWRSCQIGSISTVFTK